MKLARALTYFSVASLVLATNASLGRAQEKRILFLGAGGEPFSTQGTVFDDSLKNFVRSTNGLTQWKTSIYADGDHAKTESILKTQTQGNNQGPIFPETLEAQIQAYEKKILAGELKSGDQILLVIETHGAAALPGQQTHSVNLMSIPEIDVGRSSDSSSTSTSGRVSLDALARLSQLTEKTGIKLGVVDLSCYSGSTLALANSKTCVISGSGPDQTAGRFFSEQFLANLRPGKSLEDIFLESRFQGKSPAFPMISTPSGEELNQLLYPSLRPSLTFYYKKVDIGFTESILQAAECDRGEILFSSAFKNQMDQIAIALKRARPDTQRIEKLLQDYEKTQNDLLKTLRSWGSPLLKTQLAPPLPAITYENLVNSDYAADIQRLKKRAASTPEEKEAISHQIEVDRALAKEKARFLKEHPHLAHYRKAFEQLLSQLDRPGKLALQIMNEERKLYSSLYQKEKTPNPCSDFVL